MNATPEIYLQGAGFEATGKTCYFGRSSKFRGLPFLLSTCPIIVSALSIAKPPNGVDSRQRCAAVRRSPRRHAEAAVAICKGQPAPGQCKTKQRVKHLHD